MQQIMKQLGYDAGGFDGIYGKKLDTAFASFAADNELVAQDGVIRPADVDAVMNAWLDALPEGEWRGEGRGSDPVNVALTVTPEDGADDSGMVTYSWSLTNLGSAHCTFAALLLTFGETHDFRSEDLVMALDGVELRANAGNSASGSFTADMEWGEGSLHFAALAIDDATGEKWLSNAVTYANETEALVKTVTPIPVEVDVTRLPDGIWPVAFNKGDIFAGASGIYLNGVHIFTEDRFAPEEVEALAVGDSIVVGSETIEVRSIESGEGVSINGGVDGDNGVELQLDEESGVFRVSGLDDRATYSDHGVTTLMIDENTAYTDVSDPTQNPTIVRGADIVDAIAKSEEGVVFDENNTRVTVEGGKVVSISHLYVP
jgi:peptidoglycan hydrolase-like protein with peptidoglycan-binding domain